MHQAEFGLQRSRACAHRSIPQGRYRYDERRCRASGGRALTFAPGGDTGRRSVFRRRRLDDLGRRWLDRNCNGVGDDVGSLVGAVDNGCCIVDDSDVAETAWHRVRTRWVCFDLARLNSVANHLERQKVVFLLAQDGPQQVDVRIVKLAVTRWCPLGLDQTLTFEKADLRDGDVGELLKQDAENFADGEIGCVRHGSIAPFRRRRGEICQPEAHRLAAGQPDRSDAG